MTKHLQTLKFSLYFSLKPEWTEKKITRSSPSVNEHTHEFFFFFLHAKFQFIGHNANSFSLCRSFSCYGKKSTIFSPSKLAGDSIFGAMNFVKRCFLCQNDVVSSKMTIFSRVKTMIFPFLTIFFFVFFAQLFCNSTSFLSSNFPQISLWFHRREEKKNTKERKNKQNYKKTNTLSSSDSTGSSGSSTTSNATQSPNISLYRRLSKFVCNIQHTKKHPFYRCLSPLLSYKLNNRSENKLQHRNFSQLKHTHSLTLCLCCSRLVSRWIWNGRRDRRANQLSKHQPKGRTGASEMRKSKYCVFQIFSGFTSHHCCCSNIQYRTLCSLLRDAFFFSSSTFNGHNMISRTSFNSIFTMRFQLKITEEMNFSSVLLTWFQIALIFFRSICGFFSLGCDVLPHCASLVRETDKRTGSYRVEFIRPTDFKMAISIHIRFMYIRWMDFIRSFRDTGSDNHQHTHPTTLTQQHRLAKWYGEKVVRQHKTLQHR